MKPIEVIQAAYDRLLDEHDEDPRSALMRDLASLLNAPQALPDGQLELTATVQPGGRFRVTDQHGRELAGVQSVVLFRDQTSKDVMQINL